MPENNAQVVPIDKTTLMFVEALVELYADEPPAPDPDRHVGSELSEVARVHDEWSAMVAAYRLLIGARLTDRAVEQFHG